MEFSYLSPAMYNLIVIRDRQAMLISFMVPVDTYFSETL